MKTPHPRPTPLLISALLATGLHLSCIALAVEPNSNGARDPLVSQTDVALPAKESLSTRIKFYLFDWRYLATLKEIVWNHGREPIIERSVPKGVPHLKPAMMAALHWSPSTYAPIQDANPETASAYLQKNRDELTAQIREAAASGAIIIATPEYAIAHGPGPDALTKEEISWTKDSIFNFSEAIPGPSTEHFGRLAKELGVYLHVNIVERGSAPGEFFNALVAMGPDGEIKAHHRKVRLFGNEANYMTSGTKGTIYDTPYGRIGLLVCADSYHLPLLEAYRSAGVNLMIVSAAWTIHNNAMSWMRVSSRIVGAPLMLSNQTEFADAGVVQKRGKVESHIRQSTGVVLGTLPGINKCSRAHLPSK